MVESDRSLPVVLGTQTDSPHGNSQLQRHLLPKGGADLVSGQRKQRIAQSCICRRRRLSSTEGLTAVAASSLIFATMGAAVSSLSGTFSGTQAMMVRCLIQCICSFLFLSFRALPKLGLPEVRLWVLFRGFVGSLSVWIFFWAVTQIPLGDVNALIFMAPIFTLMLSRALLKEPLLAVEVIPCIASVVGVVLIAHPSCLFGEYGGQGGTGKHGRQGFALSLPRELVVVVCLAGAMFNGFVFLIVGRIGKAAHWMSLSLSFSLFGLLVSSSAILLGVERAHWPSPNEVGIWPYVTLVAIGTLAIVGDSFSNFGMQREKPAIASITRQLDVPLAYIWELILFRNQFVWWSGAGAVLVLCNSTALLFRQVFCERSCELAINESCEAVEHFEV